MACLQQQQQQQAAAAAGSSCDHLEFSILCKAAHVVSA
jgi:hypothetical protein